MVELFLDINEDFNELRFICARYYFDSIFYCEIHFQDSHFIEMKSYILSPVYQKLILSAAL